MFGPRLLLLLCVIFWGSGFVATKICLDYVDPVELIGLRALIGLPLLAAVIRLRRLPFQFDRRDLRAITIGSLVLTAHFVIQITGIRYTTATNTGWIISVTPLVMAVLALVLLRERLSGRAVVGIGLATVGIVLLVSGGDIGSLKWLSSFGDWLILASAHTWALYTVAVRNVSRTHAPLVVTLAVFIPVGVLTLGWMVVTSDWTTLFTMPLEGWLSLLYLAIPGLALGHWFWQEGVAALGAARAGIYLYLEPIATTVVAVPLLGEHFGPFTALGGGLVLLGVYWAEKRRVAKSAQYGCKVPD